MFNGRIRSFFAFDFSDSFCVDDLNVHFSYLLILYTSVLLEVHKNRLKSTRCAATSTLCTSIGTHVLLQVHLYLHRYIISSRALPILERVRIKVFLEIFMIILDKIFLSWILCDWLTEQVSIIILYLI